MKDKQNQKESRRHSFFVQRFIIVLFFIGILIEGSFNGIYWYKIKVIPDFSGELKLSDCLTDLSHITSIAKKEYRLKHVRASCKEYGYLMYNRISNEYYEQ